MANSRIYFKSEAGGTTTLSRDTSANSGNLVLPASGSVASVDTAVTDNAIARFDGATGKLQNSGVIIDDNGNIGIGTGSPIDKLTMYSASGNLFSRSQSGTSTLLTGVYSDGTTCVNSLGNYPLILLTNNAERMRIDTTGNVGIGTGSPSAPLEVITKAGINAGVRITQGTSNSTNAILQFTDNPVTKQLGAINFANDGTMAIYAGVGGTERMRIDTAGNVLLTSATGALGYGTGSGGIVTQLTSKSTAVTLNKPTGVIVMNNSALAAGASVVFSVNNSLISSTITETVILSGIWGVSPLYRIELSGVYAGGFQIRVTNITAGNLSDSVAINFTVIKGATA